MATFIPPPGYGQPNFKPSLSERAKRGPSAEERREGNSARHRELIRLLPCCVSGVEPAGTIHHLKSGPATKERGVGMRATDKWGLPLTYEEHLNGVERVGSRRELEWFQAHGIADPYGLAKALWDASGDLPRMRAIVLAHMGRG